MAKRATDLKKVLENYQFEFGLLQKIDCPREISQQYGEMLKSNLPLPDGVFQHRNEQGDFIDRFYTIQKSNLSDAETQELLALKKLSYLKSIKNYCIFFTVLTLLGIVAALIIL